MHGRSHSSATRRHSAWASALVLAAGLAISTHAQESRPIDPGAINGRSFQGLRLPLSAVRGPVSFAATRAFLWNDGGTRRLLLVGDVRIKLQVYEFSAARAAVWLQPLDPLPDGSVPYQVLVYFDRVGAPQAPAGPITLAGDRLRVPALIVPEGGITLKVDADEPARPDTGSADARFLDEAEAQTARYLRRLIPGYVEPGPDDPTSRLPRPAPRVPRLADSAAGTGRTFDPSSEPDPASAAEALLDSRAVARPTAPIFAREGIFTVAAGNLVAVAGEGDKPSALMATDGVVVEYADAKARTPAGDPRTLQVKAQRAVIFLSATKPGDVARLSRDDVLGLYLEGDVTATDGRYTMRGPRVYYDVQRNKAVVLDAVFWTYDERRRLPLYVRAKAIRQESSEQWSAEHATFSNTSFFEPELSIGATSVTITRERSGEAVAASGVMLNLPGIGGTSDPEAGDEGARERTIIHARNITLHAGPVPFFFWPVYTGDIADQPLRDLRFENNSRTGAAIKTRWNLYSLLGISKEPGTSADLLLDGYFQRGIGVGTRLAWSFAHSAGQLFAYALPDDRGTDVYSTGARRERTGEFRGLVAGENRWNVDDHWTVFMEGSYIGDPGYVGALFPVLSAERREFANRLLATRREDNTELLADVSGTFNDFLANEYLLQSRGYAVTRLPDVRYVRVGDDLLPGLKPGLVSYSSEYRASRLALAMDEATAAERGFTSSTLAQRALGINPNQTPADALRAMGLNEDAVTRLDTRHELSLQLHEGPFLIQPFGVARATFYDVNFSGYLPADGGNDDVRLWEGGGVRIATAMERVYEGVDSRFLDLHRLRHIVEPGVTLFAAGTNTEAKRLPVYDDDVEGLLDGGLVRLGVLQTFQTQRGGPGRWHSVDVLSLNTEVVLASDDARRDAPSPIGRFYDPRPELSRAGNFLNIDGVWQLSDTVALTGRSIYDFDLHQQSLASAGALVRHAPQFSSFVDAHFVNSQESTILSFGSQYELTSKYNASIFASYDAERGGFQGAAVEFRRRFQSVVFGTTLAYDDISGSTNLGFSIQPVGASGGLAVSGFGGTPSSRVGGM